MPKPRLGANAEPSEKVRPQMQTLYRHQNTISAGRKPLRSLEPWQWVNVDLIKPFTVNTNDCMNLHSLTMVDPMMGWFEAKHIVVLQTLVTEAIGDMKIVVTSTGASKEILLSIKFKITCNNKFWHRMKSNGITQIFTMGQSPTRKAFT